MATSLIEVDGIGPVRIFRRRGLKYIRISIGRNGEVRLSLPWYVSKAVGLRYLLSKKDWILSHKVDPFAGWQDGHMLTSDHSLRIYDSEQKVVRTRIGPGSLDVFVPISYDDARRKKAIDKAVKNFLRLLCEEHLIPRLRQLASQRRYEVGGVRVKHLKSRWGSCTHDKDITLNASLVQLPDELSDYVIIHELVHTRHLNHSRRFWQEVGSILPDYKERRKTLKKYNPAAIL